MSNIANYSTASNANNPIGYAKVNTNTDKIQKFAEYLHNFLPVLEAEFNDLEIKSQKRPNEVFPIKMAALSDIYKAAAPLYEWYVEKASRRS